MNYVLIVARDSISSDNNYVVEKLRRSTRLINKYRVHVYRVTTHLFRTFYLFNIFSIRPIDTYS